MLLADEDAGAMFEKLSKNQARAEHWAKLKNRTFTVMNGIALSFFIVGAFGFLALAGSQAGKDATTTGGLAFLIFIATCIYGFMVAIVYLSTITNRAISQAKRDVLNDAKLLPIIAAKLGNHKMFREWLDGH